MKVDKNKLSRTDQKRLEYRIKFIKRNKEFIELKKKGNDEEIYKWCSQFVPNPQKTFTFPITRVLNMNIPYDEALASKGLSTLEIVFNQNRFIVHSDYLNYDELRIFRLFDKDDRKSMNHTLNAVNKKDNTILIKVHLDRKKGDIKKDVGYLIDLLEEEAELLKVDIGKPKKPHWDVYDKYLQVYDLKIANPKMEWSEIVKKIIPEETYPNLNKRGKKKILVQQSAIDKVRYYGREANKMINKGGWRQI